MADIGATTWNENDDDNDVAAPNGAPEGMAPSGVNNVLRAHQGAVKRFWDRINPVKTTGGSGSAYTLTYDVPATSYYDGEVHSFVAGATCAAGATLNITGLGAVPLRMFGGAVLAGAILAGQVVQVRYKQSAGAFDLIVPGGWVRLGEQTPSVASSVAFAGIPSGVKHLSLDGEITVSNSSASLVARTAGPDGNIDSGGSDYTFLIMSPEGVGAVVPVANGSASGWVLTGAIDNITYGASVSLKINNIQAAKRKVARWEGAWRTGGTTAVMRTGSGTRVADEGITGLELSVTAGTMAGAFTLFAS